MEKNNEFMDGLEPGDMIMIQRKGPQKFIDSKKTEVRDNIMATKIEGGLSLKKDELLNKIGETLFDTNLFYPASALSHKNISYLVRIRYDANYTGGEEFNSMRDKMLQVRNNLRTEYPEFSDQVVFTLDKAPDGFNSAWSIQVDDIKRSDFSSM